MAEEDQPAAAVITPKFDMPYHQSKLSSTEVKSITKEYGVPLNLHPRVPPEGVTMDKLSEDVIRLYEQFFEFSIIRVPFSTLLLGIIKHFCVHISLSVPLGLNQTTMFELYCHSLGITPTVNLFRIFYKLSKQGHWFSFEKRVGKGAGDRRVIPDAMALRHHDSCVFDPMPDDNYSLLDVRALVENVVDLRPVPLVEVVYDKVLATKEKKKIQAARATARKKENKKRTDGEEGSSKPKTKRRKTSAIRKGQTASSGGTTSPTPIWTAPSVDNTLVIHSEDEEEDAGENLRRSHPWSSPHNVLENLDEADHVSPHSNAAAPYDPTGGALLSGHREILRGEPFGAGAIYVPEWAILQRCRVDSPMWCWEMMVHLAPPVAQEETNALTTPIDLERACLILLEERWPKLTYKGCDGKIKALKQEKDELIIANNNQANMIRELKIAVKESSAWVKEKQDLLVRLGQTKVEKFDCIHKFLPTVVNRLLRSHEYKQSLSVPGYRHSVADLLKVHPDPAPSGGPAAPTISSTLAGPPASSSKKKA
ncbi:hypothetical protein Tco_0607980 [Tanacetum coccineum]